MTTIANNHQEHVSEKQAAISDLQEKATGLELCIQKLNGEILSEKSLYETKMATNKIKSQTIAKDESKWLMEDGMDEGENDRSVVTESKARDMAVDVGLSESLLEAKAAPVGLKSEKFSTNIETENVENLALETVQNGAQVDA